MPTTRQPSPPAAPPPSDDTVLEATTAWQLRMVEAFGVCPFARQCREQARLWREVVRPDGGDLLAALTGAIARRHRDPGPADAPWEVGLLLCPDAPASASATERLIRDAADAAVRGLDPHYYVVAFHPDMPYSSQTPQQLLGFWRRSPYPMAQLVHMPTLERLKAARPGVRYVDPTDLLAVSALLGQSFSGDLADRIALTNWQTFQRDTAHIEGLSQELLAVPRMG